ncbi:MAG: histidine kinase [Ghiorsea sp.]|nr:histidine kinase [Ghiorsea sp.]
MSQQSENNTLIRQNLMLIENERREIAFELLNEIGQNLTAIRTAAQLMHRQSEGRQTHPVAESIVALTDQMYNSMHRLVHRLHPSILDKFGLSDSLQDLVEFAQEYMGLQCHLDVMGSLATLPQDLQLAVYRIVQEALTNAVRHGQATEAEVKLFVSKDALQVFVYNNGTELEDDLEALIHRKSSGIGLLGIQHRVYAWHGDLAFKNIDDGVKLSCSFPLED